MRTVNLSHDYPYPARDLWEVAIDYDCLEEVMEGVVSFEGLPGGRVEAGQSMSVMVSLFGKLPAQPYDMEVIAFDDAAMTLTSSERGAGVKSWHHRLQVQTTETGSRLTDRIDIDAGWLTPLFAMWAKFLYKKRHPPRLRILARRSVQMETGL